jgi:hypothetical protein
MVVVLDTKFGSKLGTVLDRGMLVDRVNNSLGSEIEEGHGSKLGSIIGIVLGTELGTALGS